MSRVLVVEDEPSLRSLCKLELEDEGHEVRTARDSHEAWPCVQGWNPEIAIIDMRLRGESGLVLLRRLSEANSPIRTIVYSGYSHFGDLLTCQLADAIVIKSVDLSELKATVQRLTGESHRDLLWEAPAARP